MTEGLSREQDSRDHLHGSTAWHLMRSGLPMVAGFGIATRIEAFASTPTVALSAAIGPVSGQNWSRGQCDRVQQALLQCHVFCVAWSLLLTVFLYLPAPWLGARFSDDPADDRYILHANDQFCSGRHLDTQLCLHCCSTYRFA